MWLDEWLFKECETVTNFAKRLGISRTHLTSIIVGRKGASPAVAQKIEELTHGEVTLREILLGDKAQRKRKPKERQIDL